MNDDHGFDAPSLNDGTLKWRLKLFLDERIMAPFTFILKYSFL